MKIISIYSGCGGLDLGFKKAGFHSLLATDYWDKACQSLLENNIADLVVSDGVCHHTGDTFKAFSECVRILRPNGRLYLAVYKKYRYYPIVYHVIGGVFRLMNKIKLGKIIVDNIFVKFHYLMYKLFKKQKLSLDETRNIFFDYFITPIATFQSYKDVNNWCEQNNCSIEKYACTLGNCHVFIINKNGS